MPLRDSALLEHMLAAADRIAELVAETDRETFVADWVIQNAIIRELEVLGEAAGRMSRDLMSRYPDIPWREMTGLRHKLIHDYFVVDLGVVWETAVQNLPEAAEMLRAIAEEQHGGAE